MELFADMALVDGKVVTLDANGSVAEAVASKSGRIVAVGSSEQIKSLVGPKTRLMDLKGRTVIPGLNDSHCHMIWTEAIPSAVDVIDASSEAGVRSINDILVRIADQAKRKEEGEWIIAMKEDESKLVERQHPTKWDLDKAAQNVPTLIHTVGGHLCIVNSKAFEIAGITEDTPDPVGGRFERDSKTGKLTGLIYEDKARELLMPREFPLPALEKAQEAIRRVANQYAASGLTCITEGCVDDPITVRALLELRNRGELPIRVRLDFRGDHMMSHLAAIGMVQGFGDDMLKVNGLKLFADGAISARTAWVTEPYLDRADYYGEPATTREELLEVVMDGYPRGYRFSIHANGERAINMALDVLEEAQMKCPRKDPRNRIVHCTVVTKDIMARLKKLGVLPTIFGPYPYYHGDKILPAFGTERMERMFAARSLLDAGIRLSAHSDSNAAPYPPLMGIHALVNRNSANGQPVGQSQKISVMEALSLYTTNAAYHSFEEDVMGSIEPGKYADMVILGRDILTVPPETIIDIPIDVTIMGGRVVFQRTT